MAASASSCAQWWNHFANPCRRGADRVRPGKTVRAELDLLY
ncbi:hypothetical protein [Streptomyces sp. 061-3]